MQIKTHGPLWGLEQVTDTVLRALYVLSLAHMVSIKGVRYFLIPTFQMKDPKLG